LLEKLQREFSCDALNLYDHAVHRSPAWDAACAECWAELYPTLRIAVESRVQLESTGRTTHDF
jgi:hypothetical protein